MNAVCECNKLKTNKARQFKQTFRQANPNNLTGN
jgi:hypothetical protein